MWWRSIPQDWVISSLVQEKSDQAKWRFDPQIIGASLCTGDIGTHLEQLIAQSTGLTIKRVLARFDTYPRDLPLETNTTVLLDFGDNITGTLWASQIAIGYECGIKIRIFGTEGSLEWSHEMPGILKYTKINSPTMTLSANREYMCPESRRLSRLPAAIRKVIMKLLAISIILSASICLRDWKAENRKAIPIPLWRTEFTA